MKLTDRCWTLNRSYGVDARKSLSEATRGDCTTEEVFLTENEAHEADAARCDKEESKAIEEAERWAQRAKDARARIKP